ncbi:MAG: RDD family protein [Phycisphaerales bacterium]
MRRVLILLAMCLVSLAARGDIDIGACGTSQTPGAASHGWAVLDLAEGGAALVHLPPRGTAPVTGALRVAWRFSVAPQGLAAWLESVAIVFHPETGPDGKSRRSVLVLRVRSAALGNWVFEPEGRRLPALADLPGEPTLRGFVGTAFGPIALLEDAGTLRLVALRGSAWVGVALPRAIEGDVRLLPDPAGATLLAISGDRATAWVGTIPGASFVSGVGSSGEGEATIRPAWHSRAISLAGIAMPESATFAAVQGQLLAIRGSEGTGRAGDQGGLGSAGAVWSISTGSPLMLHEIPGGDVTIVPLDRPGRLCVLSTAQDTGPTGKPRTQTRLLELSATASIPPYFDGPARIAGPLSSMDLRVLAFGMVLAVALILFYLLRPDAIPEFSLPAGFALAAPSRRFGAGLVDLAIVLVPSAVVLGVWPREVFSAASLATEPRAALAWMAAIGIGFVLSTVLEAAIGRTLGKFLFGCRVIRPRSRTTEAGIELSAGRPSLAQSAARNVVRWFLAPVAVSGFLGPSRRHRGDDVAGTAVVVVVRSSEGK